MSLNPCFLDFETRSTVELRDTGVYVYADSPETHVWCAAYAFGDGPVKLWKEGEPFPQEIGAHIAAGGMIHAWNCNFERVVWNGVLHRHHEWPKLLIENCRCDMAAALAMALPGSLEGAAAALGLDIQKDMAGRRLALQMAKPRRMEGNTPIWWNDADRLDRLYSYNITDVETERAAHKRLVALRPLEQRIWYFDQHLSDRGVLVDRHLCTQAKKIVEKATATLDAEMREVTNREVQACSNVQQIIRWLKANGCPTDSVARATLEDLLLRDDIPAPARRALELRKEAAKTSTAKIDAMLERSNGDGRMRGGLQYHGAATGRWAARGAQLQNLPRGQILLAEGDEAVKQQAIAVEALMTGDPVRVEMMYDRPLTVVADCLRAMIYAPKGRELVAADFSSIEGRGIAWLAGEKAKIAAFRAYDAGTGPDLYKVAAAGTFGIKPEQVDKIKRQIGKVEELALGYQGGPGAFRAMAGGYGLKIEKYKDIVLEALPKRFCEQAIEAWDERGRKSGMGKDAWIPAEAIKLAWRAANPNITAWWPTLEAAAIQAVRNPSAIVAAGPVKFRKNGSFLWCQLPSGRTLCYPYPAVREMETPWGTKAPKLYYKYVDQFTRKWTEGPTYGGSLSENITQAVARDIMAEAMLRVEAAGYPVILTVHDEVVAEVDAGFGSVDEFSRIMCELPSWAAGFPVAAAGWKGRRYRK